MESLRIPWNPLGSPARWGAVWYHSSWPQSVTTCDRWVWFYSYWAPDPVHRGVAGLALHGSVAARVLRARQWTVFGVRMVDLSLAIRINVDKYGSIWIWECLRQSSKEFVTVPLFDQKKTRASQVQSILLPKPTSTFAALAWKSEKGEDDVNPGYLKSGVESWNQFNYRLHRQLQKFHRFCPTGSGTTLDAASSHALWPTPQHGSSEYQIPRPHGTNEHAIAK